MSLGVAGQIAGEDELAELASQALETGEEERAIPLVRAGAERLGSALLWQWTALLERALDQHEDALESFREAMRLAPDDFKIAQGLAHTTMEAGLNAVALFERARSLAPRNGAILVGLTAARAAIGEGEEAVDQLQKAVEGAPLWINGHEQLAQLLSTQGRPDEARGSFEQAIRAFPQEPALREALLHLELRRGAFDALRAIVDHARAAGIQLPDFAIYEAVHAGECEDELMPAVLFGPESRAFDFALDTWRVRHLMRVGAPDAALPFLERGLKGAQSADLWTYAATLWRMVGDPRVDWLDGEGSLVQLFDLGNTLPPIDPLADTLRALHKAKGEYLDQSVRGGTQTDGPLLSRIDPVIRATRTAITTAVDAYVKQLPPVDETHPLLRHRRDRKVRYSGSWSVRLRDGGRHSNHVHPQGWISSALYVSLPARVAGEPEDAGWFTIGQPDERLRLNLEPSRKIEPLPARLVLFPSYMWHGTVPFSKGERLTIAFDVKQPL